MYFETIETDSSLSFLDALNSCLNEGWKVHTITTPSKCAQQICEGITEASYCYIAFIYKDGEKNDKQEALDFEKT